MPELPEVETVKRILENTIKNRIIEHVEVLYPRMILSGVDSFVTKIKDVEITDIKRKGKYLLFFLSNHYVLISHLRMEGKYQQVALNEPSKKHTRVIFYFHDFKMFYDDSRCFGIMELVPEYNYLNTPCLKNVGLEPFEISNPEYLKNAYTNKHIQIKSAILDQSIMCGLGNIYADETLYASKINPYREACSLSLNELDTLIKNACLILTKAIDAGGSTVSSYHPALGVDGMFQNDLMVYGKKNTICPNCGTILRKDFCNGRGTTYCPKCQHVALRVALTGKIASGKSTVLKYLKEKGFPTFSCDEVINQYYQKDLKFKAKLITMFGEMVINDHNQIEKGYIKQVVSQDSLQKKKLENLIHPMVKHDIEKFILSNKETSLVIVEVPLLFESKMNTIFDYIIGVDASLSTQKNHLDERGSKNKNLDLLLNNSSSFDKNAQKCDFIIHNDGTLDDLYKQIDEIIDKIKICI